jgi:arylsulfatase A-like enzyme
MTRIGHIPRVLCVVGALALLACARQPGPMRPVVLIVVDTLRADRLGAWGYTERPTSPHLDAWLSRARVYEHGFSTSPWTLPSMASLYTGRWTVNHGAGRLEQHPDAPTATPLRPELPTLAERFQAAGYATGAIVTNTFLAPVFGVARGFSDYDFEAAGVTRSRRADEVVRRAFVWIDLHADRPFLLFVHFFDPHMAYDAPPPFRGRFSKGLGKTLSEPVVDVGRLRAEAGSLPDADRRLVAAAYDEEVAFVDSQLGVLLDGLEQRGVLRNALVVLTADHGEELFDHGGFEHGHALWQEILHVPLAIWGPGVRAGRETSAVSLVDITPTLLDAAGLAPLPGCDGISLWPNLSLGDPLPPRPLYAGYVLYGVERKAVIGWPEKLVWTPALDLWKRFDLASDPGEQRAGAVDASPTSQGLQRTALAHWKQAVDDHQASVRLDGDLRAKLEGLGYVE